jgi:hypothetical protein
MNGIENIRSLTAGVLIGRGDREAGRDADPMETKLDQAASIVEAKIAARRQAADEQAMQLGQAIGAAHSLDENRVAALIADPFAEE